MNVAMYNFLKALLVSLMTLQTQQTTTINTLKSLLDAAQVATSVSPSDNLQQIMDSSPDNAVLYLQPGIYRGHFVCGHPITLKTNGLTLSGQASASDAQKMAVLASPDANPSYTTAPGASGCWLDTIGVTSLGTKGTAVSFGTGVETTIADLPKDGGLKSVVVWGDGTTLKRAVALHGINLMVQNSYIAGARIAGQDSQGIWILNGPGPYVIQNNYIEAAGENLLVGGDRVRIPNLVPSDIQILNNTFAKNVAWKGITGFNIKNLLELKNAQRVTISHNVFEDHWQDAQPGYAIVFTPRNQYNDQPWTVVRDVVFSDNLVKNTGGGINLIGYDDLATSQRSVNIQILDNRLILSSATYGGSGRCFQLGRAPDNVLYNRNTCITDGSSAIYAYQGGVKDPITGSEFTNNIWPHNKYGFYLESGVKIPDMFPMVMWSSNVVITPTPLKTYPVGTTFMDQGALNNELSDPLNAVLKPDTLLTAGSKDK